MGWLIIYILFTINGLVIVIIWTKDILTNPEIDRSKGFFTARERESGNLFWPHWIAEYVTALLLVLTTVLIYFDFPVGNRILPFAAGALFYTSLNSLGWAFAKKERFAYSFPMIFAFLLTVVYFLLLVF